MPCAGERGRAARGGIDSVDVDNFVCLARTKCKQVLGSDGGVAVVAVLVQIESRQRRFDEHGVRVADCQRLGDVGRGF